MLTIIRKTTWRALTAERDELRDKLDQARADHAGAVEYSERVERVAEGQLKDLAQTHADLIKARRYGSQLRGELVEARRTLDDSREVLAEMRTDLDRMRADAADPEHGETFRAALAYGVLKRMYAEVRDRGPGRSLGRPWDLLAIILGFDEAASDVPAEALAEVEGGSA